MSSKESMRSYYLRNREKLLKRAKEYREAHREEIAAYKKKWAAKHEHRLKAARKEYYISNKADLKSKQEQRYAKNREKILQTRRRRYQNDAEKFRKEKQHWYQQNRDKHRNSANEWAARNTIKIRDYKREWLKNDRLSHPEKYHARWSLYYARRKGATVGDVRQIASFYHDVRHAEIVHCHWCRCPIPKGSRTVDHVVPLSKGGAHAIHNFVPSCPRCNSRKGAKLPEEFRV